MLLGAPLVVKHKTALRLETLQIARGLPLTFFSTFSSLLRLLPRPSFPMLRPFSLPSLELYLILKIMDCSETRRTRKGHDAKPESSISKINRDQRQTGNRVQFSKL